MKKVLFVATVVKLHIMKFHLPYLKWFKDKGYETHVFAKNDYENLENCDIPYCDVFINASFARSPLNLENVKVYEQLKRILKENCYDIIHCHTPVGGAVTRLAARENRVTGTKVIYTAHGFHFFKGAPIQNWLLYYPIEKWLARYTDTLITINNEDYSVAAKFKTKTHLVNGIGINLEKFKKQTLLNKQETREQYGYSHEDKIIIYTGELSYRKHQDLVIEAISKLSPVHKNIKLLLVGQGALLKEYKELVSSKDIEDHVFFLGYRDDISELLMMSDIAISTSRQEGLPVNIMEAMATGLPIVVTDCRGNRDLIQDGENGFVVNVDDASDLANKLEQVLVDDDLKRKFSNANLARIKKYSLDEVKKDMSHIYGD